MTMICRSRRILCLFAVALCFAVTVQAQESENLRLRTWLKPIGDAVVGQQLELNIEIATSTWFSGGTRLQRFEMDDAIVLRRDKFAVNSSRREQGNTWSVQLWTITIYPQRAGNFEIPPIDIQLTVANDDGVAEPARLRTERISFSAEIPQDVSAANIGKWLASPRFEVREQFDRPLEGLAVGDAFRRTIILEADNVAAMMLPAITIETGVGLAVYQKPPRLEDRVNRGTYRAIRRESISYVVETPGNYELPALTLSWWNTQESKLERIELPAQSLQVGGSEPSSTRINAEESALSPARAAIISLALLILLLLFAQHKKVWPFDDKDHEALQALSEPQLRRKMLTAFERGDRQRATWIMVEWIARAMRDSGHHPATSLRQLLTENGYVELLPRLDQFMSEGFSLSAQSPAPKGSASIAKHDMQTFDTLLTDLSEIFKSNNFTASTHQQLPLNPRS